MFPYDPQLAAAAQQTPQSIPGVLQLMQTIHDTCVDTDGLKWFNWLYLQVTQAVEASVTGGEFRDPGWLAELDVQFAKLYFDAIRAALSGAPCPGCWEALFSCRNRNPIARIQFALAGMNAHINHDLPLAVIATCKATNTVPQHGTAQYNDYTAVNQTLSGFIDEAKQTLHVRLLGDPLPVVSHLEDLMAAWDLGAAREAAWDTAESLWQDSACGAAIRMGTIDGLTTVIGKALLVPVP
jgi:hypothetical protein